MTAEEIIGRLEGDYLERLKWLVLREFRILPGSKMAKETSDEDFVLCGAHMVLDNRLRSDVSNLEGDRNGSFDERRFWALSEGRYE